MRGRSTLASAPALCLRTEAALALPRWRTQMFLRSSTSPSPRSLTPRSRMLIALVALACATVTSPAPAQQKPTLQPSEYGRWESFTRGGAEWSADAEWLAYGVDRVNGDNELRIHRVDAPADDGPLHIAPHGTTPTFSEAGWIAWDQSISEKERSRLEKAKEPVRTAVGLLDLSADTAEARTFAETRAFAFDASGRFLSLLGYAPEEPKGKGADLRVLDLASGMEIGFGNVTEQAWSGSGSLLAFAVATGGDEGNGLQLYDAASGRLQPLHGSGSTYGQLAWHEERACLAALQSANVASVEGKAQIVQAWCDLDGDRSTSWELDASDPSVEAGYEISRSARPRWSDDATRVAIGLRPAEPEDEDASIRSASRARRRGRTPVAGASAAGG